MPSSSRTALSSSATARRPESRAPQSCSRATRRLSLFCKSAHCRTGGLWKRAADNNRAAHGRDRCRGPARGAPAATGRARNTHKREDLGQPLNACGALHPGRQGRVHPVGPARLHPARTPPALSELGSATARAAAALGTRRCWRRAPKHSARFTRLENGSATSESPFEGLPSGPRSALAAATSTSGQAWPGTNEESTPAVEQPADAGLDAARSGVGRSWGTAKAGEGRDCAGGHHGVTPSSWACCGAGVRATRARA
jgi:hypothetical protein